jgi:tetratricopeptide (TPR) repeat protein
MADRFSVKSLWILLPLVLMAALQAAAQKAGSPAPPRTGGSTPPNPSPGTTFDPLNKIPTHSLIVFGKVALKDGSPPAQLVIVERVCKGVTQTGGFADSKGRFSFDLGVLNKGLGAASTIDSFNNNQLAGNPITPEDLKKCEVRAGLTGYRSQSISLEPAATGQKTQVGTIILAPVGKEESPALCASDAQAPSNARKAFEKGLDAAAKARWQDAIESFRKATSLYPKYGSAWLSLGILQAGSNNAESALQSYAQAIAADDKFALPYIESAVLEDIAQKYDRVLEHTERVIQFYPGAFPRAYFLNAWANLRLRRLDQAVKSATEGLKLDDEHRFPELEFVSGMALLGKQDKAGATKHLEAYVTLAPGGVNAAVARQQLSALRSTR